MSDTTASRRGSKNSGIRSSAQSYDGSVILKMFDDDGTVKVNVEIAEDSSIYGQSYFCGTIDELKEVLINGRREKVK